jgi:hypothetical protein
MRGQGSTEENLRRGDAMGKEGKLILIMAIVAYALIYLYNSNYLPGTTTTA